MLIKANTRKPSRGRASYLMRNKENDRAEVMDIRGVVFDDDVDFAFAELNGRGEKDKKMFMSASINPAKGYDHDMTRDQWMRSVELIEEALGLQGQPRIVVQHEKKGADGLARQHIHIGWHRERDGKLVSDSNMRHKVVKAKIAMELEFGHTRTKDYDRQEYAVAQGRMAKQQETDRQQRFDRAADLFAENRPDLTKAQKEQEAYDRMMAAKEKRDRERGAGREI